MSWLAKVLNLSVQRQKQARNDLNENSYGLPGENIGAPIFPGQSSVFDSVDPLYKRRKKNVHKKGKPKRNPGDRHDVDKVQPLR